MSMPDITLNVNKNNLSEVIGYLKLLVEHAETKNNHIDKLRQMNFSITLFIFAGLAGYGLSQTSTVVMLCVTIVLVCFMIMLSSYDHKLHKYLHGMQKTRVNHLRTLSNVISNGNSNVSITYYYKEGENRAEDENCRSLKDFIRFIREHKVASLETPNNVDDQDDQKLPSQMRVVYYLLIRGAFASLIPFYLIQLTSKSTS